eukprot:592395_1
MADTVANTASADEQVDVSNKDKLKSMMDQAKNEYLEKHKDLVDEFVKTNPNANTLDILNHIGKVTQTESNDGGGVSLNCLFLLFIGLLMVMVLRVQYNLYVEELFISSLFFSLNPSIDIALLLNDLPFKLDKCSPPSYAAANKKWMQKNIEYCDFVSTSINRKLLYIYEYSSTQYKQHSTDLYTFTQWIFDRHANANAPKPRDTVHLMPISSIHNKELLERFIVLHYENVQRKWNAYVDKMERTYAKKAEVSLNDILYRLSSELTHYWLIHSLYCSESNQLEENAAVNPDIMNAIEGYLQFEYFRDGFVCIWSQNEDDKPHLIIDFLDMIDTSQMQYYVRLIRDKQMICICTFEAMGRSKNEIAIYLNVIEESLRRWKALQYNLIDKCAEIKATLSSELAAENDEKVTPFWNGYEWLKASGISMDSLLVHDRLVYGNSQTYVALDPNDTNDDAPVKVDGVKQFYSNNYWFHRFFFDQFETKNVTAQRWSEMRELMGVINQQFGTVSALIQQMVQYIDAHSVFYNAGFVWLLCDGNGTLYFEETLRYNALSTADGVILAIDLWSHSFYHDFVKGHRMKEAEYGKINKQKFKTKETVGQAVDVKHIGTALQKTFNYPRTRMEMLGYYINSLFHNLAWIKVAKRWEVQCKSDVEQTQTINKKRDRLETSQHHEL